MRKGTIVAILLVAGACVWGVSSYSRLVTLDQAVLTRWAGVENAYQHRMGMIPNLVETLKSAAAYEKETFGAVADARTRAGEVSPGRDITANASAFSRYQIAQEQLGTALSKLVESAERRADLKSNPSWRDLRTEMTDTESRITAERARFNEAAQAFNARRRKFPMVLVAGLTGFHEKQYFLSPTIAPTASRQ